MTLFWLTWTSSHSTRISDEDDDSLNIENYACVFIRSTMP